MNGTKYDCIQIYLTRASRGLGKACLEGFLTRVTKTSQNFSAHGGILLTPIGTSDCQLPCAEGFNLFLPRNRFFSKLLYLSATCDNNNQRISSQLQFCCTWRLQCYGEPTCYSKYKSVRNPHGATELRRYLTTNE